MCVNIYYVLGEQHNHFNPKLNNLNFHSLEAVSCYRDLQLKCVNITQMCLIRDETFAKLDV